MPPAGVLRDEKARGGRGKPCSPEPVSSAARLSLNYALLPPEFCRGSGFCESGGRQTVQVRSLRQGNVGSSPRLPPLPLHHKQGTMVARGWLRSSGYEPGGTGEGTSCSEERLCLAQRRLPQKTKCLNSTKRSRIKELSFTGSSLPGRC